MEGVATGTAEDRTQRALQLTCGAGSSGHADASVGARCCRCSPVEEVAQFWAAGVRR
jgi:hypothetical protein